MYTNDFNVVLRSDFSDYYDDEFDTHGIVYERLSNKTISIASGITMLKLSGIPVAEPCAVRKMTNAEKVRILTTNSSSQVCGLGEARNNYFNSICVPCDDEMILKVLYIGKHVIHILMDNKVRHIESMGDVHGKRITNIPIFSIDYINDKGMSKAIRINNVERLESLGIQDILRKDDVIGKIKNYMISRGF